MIYQQSVEARFESRSVLLQNHKTYNTRWLSESHGCIALAANRQRRNSSRERTVRWPGSLGKDAPLRQVVGRAIRRQNVSLSQPAIWFGVDTVLSENPLK